MRLFIAIDLPVSVKEYLRKVQKIVQDAASRESKLSLTHDFHVTLKFLGSTTGNQRVKIEKALLSTPFQSFKTHLTPLGSFGGRIPRVIWVGIVAPPWLSHTAEHIEKTMSKLGFPRENRFVSHITLARVKLISNPKAFLERLSHIKVDPISFEVKSFHLFESQLSPKGAVHTSLRSFPSAS